MLFFTSGRGLGLCMEGQWNRAMRVRCTKCPPAAGHLVSLHSVNFFTPHFKGRGEKKEEGKKAAAVLPSLKSPPVEG